MDKIIIRGARENNLKNINIYFLNLFMKQRAEALEKQKY